MGPDVLETRVLEFHDEGHGALGGSRTEDLLAAIENVETARIFRRLLWPRLAVVIVVAFTFMAATGFASAGLFTAFCILLCGAGIVAALAEWCAEWQLTTLVNRCSTRNTWPLWDGRVRKIIAVWLTRARPRSK